jgi:hypothetical protein
MGALTHTCPVCGYPALREPPRSPKSGGGSYEICPSCGFQFGVTDDDKGISHEKWREDWIYRGMPWDGHDIGSPPANWNPKQQLAKLLGRGG